MPKADNGQDKQWVFRKGCGKMASVFICVMFAGGIFALISYFTDSVKLAEKLTIVDLGDERHDRDSYSKRNKELS